MRLSKLALLLALIAAVGLPIGCGRDNPRVVLVPHTEPTQLAEDVWAYVYVTEADGKKIKSANRVKLSEGLWVGSADLDD